MSADWEKRVDKEAEKFREQVYKAANRYYGSTSSHETADILAFAFAAIVKKREVDQAACEIFTKEFLDKYATNGNNLTEGKQA
jgi:hypothetical protein